MELAGTDEARKLLARWAADAPGTTLSDDAAEALKRMEMREKEIKYVKGWAGSAQRVRVRGAPQA